MMSVGAETWVWAEPGEIWDGYGRSRTFSSSWFTKHTTCTFIMYYVHMYHVRKINDH